MDRRASFASIPQTPANDAKGSHEAHSTSRSGKLRALPGYATPGGAHFALPLAPPSATHSFGAGAMPTGTLKKTEETGNKNLLSRPYRTREHLYYEGETTAAGLEVNSQPVSSFSRSVSFATYPVENSQERTQSSLLDTTSKGPLAARIMEDAPPTCSTYDTTLTPDRRHATMDFFPTGATKGESPFNSRFGTTQDSYGISSLKKQRTQDVAGTVPDVLMSSTSRGIMFDGTKTHDPEVNRVNKYQDSFLDTGSIADNWITVFGFTPGQSADILAAFKRLGEVVQIDAGQGNWLHLCYATRWGAQKALARNATVFPVAPSSLIGVLPRSRAAAAISVASDSLMSPLSPETGAPSVEISELRTPAPKSSSVFITRSTARKAPVSKTVRTQALEDQASKSQGPSTLTRVLGVLLGW